MSITTVLFKGGRTYGSTAMCSNGGSSGAITVLVVSELNTTGPTSVDHRLVATSMALGGNRDCGKTITARWCISNVFQQRGLIVECITAQVDLQRVDGRRQALKESGCIGSVRAAQMFQLIVSIDEMVKNRIGVVAHERGGERQPSEVGAV